MFHRTSKAAGHSPNGANSAENASSVSGRRAAAWFVVRFVAFMALFYFITIVPWFRQTLFPLNLNANAAVAAATLRVLGEQTRADGPTVISPRFALEIRRGCEAIEPAALFVAALLAFPATWRHRLVGLMIGIPFIAALNLVRIITLYYAGVHIPQHFETLHLEVWQSLFVICTLGMWLAWAYRANRSLHSTAPASASPCR